MNNIITFKNHQIQIKDINGKIWLTASDIAKAIGYKNIDQISKIYNNHRDEFSDDMSQTVDLTVSGNLKTKTRIFNTRGCHLIAMFAHTPFAKEFRKWVLDVLEKLNQPTLPVEDTQTRIQATLESQPELLEKKVLTFV